MVEKCDSKTNRENYTGKKVSFLFKSKQKTSTSQFAIKDSTVFNLLKNKKDIHCHLDLVISHKHQVKVFQNIPYTVKS